MSSTSSACAASPGVRRQRKHDAPLVRVILFLGDPRAEYRLGAINLQHQGKIRAAIEKVAELVPQGRVAGGGVRVDQVADDFHLLLQQRFLAGLQVQVVA